MGQILDGKKFANLRAEQLKEKVKNLKEKGIVPLFCVINIGDDQASKLYLRTKKRKADQIGIKQRIYQLPEDIEEAEVLRLIEHFNADRHVYGVMVQLPVPSSISEERLVEHIDPEKDVDGLNPANEGRLWEGNQFVEPATAAGIIALLDHYQIKLEGKNVVIIGRSRIVGKPLAGLMLNRNATISVLHTQTKNLKEYTKRADILISAAGQANLINADMIKNKAVIIDVGINHFHGHLCGDVNFPSVINKASFVTPVPGGVGPLTVEFLMEEVIKLTERAHGLR